jgi:ParB family transcriptional regulator, chromosome partitioning protein
MEIVELPITKIHPDPNQPRRHFDEEEIEGMAQSIKSEGVINPIEVDTKYFIITGERRWRAAKIAGLKTVPAKVMKIGKDERFMRQVVENIHHDTMNDWEVANSLKKLLTAWRRHASTDTKRIGGDPDQGKGWLSRKLGKSRSYINEKLVLLEASEQFQKKVREGKLEGVHIRSVRLTPPEYKAAIEKKILSGEFTSSDASRELAAGIHRDPTVAKKLLAIDYSKYPKVEQVASVVSKISPRITDKIIKAMEPSDELGKLTTHLLKWLDTNTPESVGKFNLHRCVVNLQTAEKEIAKWLKRK